MISIRDQATLFQCNLSASTAYVPKQYCDHNVGSTVSIILFDRQQAQSKDGSTIVLRALAAFMVAQ
jgi:hypothetical protein